MTSTDLSVPRASEADLVAEPPGAAPPGWGTPFLPESPAGATRAAGGPAGGRLAAVRSVLVGSSVWTAAARVSALALVAAGAVTWSVFDRTVTVDVDGTEREVRIFGSGVDDVLAEAGLEPGGRDIVSPGPDESVADGGTVTVRYARPFTVTTDGVAETIWTHERTVDAALAAAGLRLDGARLSASRSQPIGREGLDLDVVTRKAATLTVGGAAQPRETTARTVGELLAEAGAVPDADDRVNPPVGTPVTEGIAVTLNVVAVSDVQETLPVAAPERRVDSAEYLVGTTTVVEEGADGVETVTWRVTTVDGVEESRTEVARAVTTPPVERVVARGTKPRPAPAPAAPADPAAPAAPVPAVGGDVDSLNWAALAQCESGGNPSIVSSNGKYHGLYQFDAGTWRSVGGSGVASQASADEQTARAKILYQSRGASPWPSCGRRLFS